MKPEEMAGEVKRLARQLQQMGRTDLLYQSLGGALLGELQIEAARGRLLPLRIMSDYRFFVGEGEVKLQPVHKALYLLFLNHPEGLEFKQLGNHREELLNYYKMITQNMPRGGSFFDKAKIDKSIDLLTDPLNNAINEKCSRIKRVFLELMDEYSASYYIISSHIKRHFSGSQRVWFERLKIITLPRELVVWDGLRLPD